MLPHILNLCSSIDIPIFYLCLITGKNLWFNYFSSGSEETWKGFPILSFHRSVSRQLAQFTRQTQTGWMRDECDQCCCQVLTFTARYVWRHKDTVSASCHHRKDAQSLFQNCYWELAFCGGTRLLVFQKFPSMFVFTSWKKSNWSMKIMSLMCWK